MSSKTRRTFPAISAAMIAVMLDLAGAPMPAAAEEAPKAEAGPRVVTQDFGSWTYQCEQPVTAGKLGRPQCGLSQKVMVKQGDNTVPAMAVVFFRRPDGKGHLLTIRTPLGIRLKPGLSIASDRGAPVVLSFDFCGERGCWVDQAAGDTLIQALKSGTTGRAKMILVNGQELTIEFPLSGLTPGLAALDGPPLPAATKNNG